MRQQCINAVQTAIGRTLKAGEAKDVEARITKAMQQLARKDRQAWLGMSKAQRLTEAGRRVADDLQAEFAKIKQREALKVLSMNVLQQDMAQMQLRGIGPQQALNRMLAVHRDSRSVGTSVDSAARSINAEASSRLLDLWQALKGDWLGFVANREAFRDLARELHGQDSGSPVAKAGAKAWLEVTESLRTRFNQAGGAVGKLEDWGLPHTHSMEKIARAGRDQWVSDTMPLLNRDHYVNEDGTPMDDQQVSDFLSAAYDTLSTDGANKLDASAMGAGMRANRGSEERSIHFRDGDAYIEYQNRYGEEDLLSVLEGHLRGVSLDIALVEKFGPNPAQAFKVLQGEAFKQAMLAGGEASKRASRRQHANNALWMEVTRTRETVGSVALNTMTAYRQWNVASKLGGTTLAALTDGATMTQTLLHHGAGVQGVASMFGKQLAMLNPADAGSRQTARMLGLGIDELIGSLSRFSDDGLASSATFAGRMNRVSGQAATAIMRASGLNALTAANKAAFSKILLALYGEKSRTQQWGDLSAMDRRWMEGSGVTEQDWNIWRASDTLDVEGEQYLHASRIHALSDDAIRQAVGDPQMSDFAVRRARNDAATRLLAHVLDEQGLAVIEAGAREQALLFGEQARGTWHAEAWRSMMQFKSFVAALMTRHGQRAMAMETGAGKAGYGAALFAMLTVLGAVSVQLAGIVNGQDPQDMTTDAFWRSAILKGGGLGIFGDVVNAGATPTGKGMGDLLGGPVLSDVSGVLSLTVGNTKQAMEGKNTNAASESLKFGREHLPGQNLWYTRAAFDHMVYNQLQDMANPGWSQRQEQRQRQMYDRSYWWSPGEMTPEGQPDWGKAVGE